MMMIHVAPEGRYHSRRPGLLYSPIMNKTLTRTLLALAAGAASLVVTAQTPARAPVGLALSMGTINADGQQAAGSFVLTSFYVPALESAYKQDVKVVVHGPAGWNKGQAMEFEVAEVTPGEGYWSFTGAEDVPLVSGNYTAEAVIDGKTLRSEISVDATKRLEVPQIQKVQNSATSQVSLRWRAVPGAEIYLAGLYDAAGNELARTASTDNEESFTGLSLEAGATYYAQVIGFSYDPNFSVEQFAQVPSQVNVAYDVEEFKLR